MCRIFLAIFFTAFMAEASTRGTFQKVKAAVLAEDPSIKVLEFQVQLPPDGGSLSLGIQSEIEGKVAEERLESDLMISGNWKSFSKNPVFLYSFKTPSRGNVILSSFSDAKLGHEFQSLQKQATKILNQAPVKNVRQIKTTEKLDGDVAELATTVTLKGDSLSIEGKSLIQTPMYVPLMNVIATMIRQDIEDENPKKVEALKVAVQEYVAFLKKASGLNQTSPWSWKASEERLKNAKFGLPFENVTTSKPRE